MTTTAQQGTTTGLSVLFQQYPGGPASDVTGLTIEIQRVNDAAVVLAPTGTGITHMGTGSYAYNWATPISTTIGDYLVTWAANEGTATEIINVVSASGATAAPCGWTIDTGCCSTWDTYSAQVQADATDYATTVMWSATGRQFGACQVTVRPAGTTPFGSLMWSGPLYWDDGTWYPYIFSGQWFNAWWGSGSPWLGVVDPRAQAYLPGPVASISNVTVDNVIIPPSSYRVDDTNWLVRTDGQFWPVYQDMNVDSGTNTFFCTYLRGTPVPTAVSRAAGTLACEYAKACIGEPCRLPGRVTQLARQGVTVSMVPLETLLEKGLTGIPEVDQIITAFNPYGMKWRPSTRLYSPDLGHTRMTTWP